MQIEINIENQNISAAYGEIFSGSVGILTVKINKNIPENLIPALRFVHEGDTQYYKAIIETDTAIVPHEVIKAPGFYIAFAGYEMSDSSIIKFLPTEGVFIPVKENAYGSPDDPQMEEEESRSLIGQILTECETVRQEAKEAKTELFDQLEEGLENIQTKTLEEVSKVEQSLDDKLLEKQDVLEFDETPKEQSDNLLKSDAIYKSLSKKADLQNESGGFSGGENSSSMPGGAIGKEAVTTAGGAVGMSSNSSMGGAVGYKAKTSSGFAGGHYAQTMDENGQAIDAVQLGRGTNQNKNTLKVYDFELMDEKGYIPKERIKEFSSLSNALKGKKSGPFIKIEDASSLPNFIRLNLESKNLMKIQPARKYNPTFDECYFLKKGTYTLSLKVEGATKWRVVYTLFKADGTAVTQNYATAVHLTTSKPYVSYNSYTKAFQWKSDLPNTTQQFTIDDDYYVGINIYYGDTESVTKISGQVEKGTKQTEMTEYIPDITSVKVKRFGKNFIKKRPYFTPKAPTLESERYYLPKGTYTLSMDIKSATSWRFNFCLFDMEQTKVTTPDHIISNNDDTKITYNIENEQYQSEENITYLKQTFTTDDDYYFSMSVLPNEATEVPVLINAQIEAGEEKTDYSEYIEPTEYTPSPDGTIDGVFYEKPYMTFVTASKQAAILKCEYNRDINSVIENITNAILSLGGNV